VELFHGLYAAEAAKQNATTRECLRCHAVISKEAERCPECGFPRL
jgi:ribosomal protein L40E